MPETGKPTGIAVTRERAAAFLRSALFPSKSAAAGDPAETAAAMVRSLSLVQMDPVRVVARNHDLVLHNRIPGYAPSHLEGALARKLVFEYLCGIRSVLPMEEYPYFVPSMRAAAAALESRLESLGSAPEQVLRALERDGPLPSRAIESEEKVSGYWDSNQALRTKATSHALQLLHDGGRVVASLRKNGEIWFDLPERAIPAGLFERGREMSRVEADAFLTEKYYRAYRLFDAGHQLFGFRRLSAAARREAAEADVKRGVLVPVAIEGVKRQYYCLARDEDGLRHADGDPAFTRILPPLDNFLWRRERLQDIFGFSYTWELYTPAHKRKYGPYTMPVLCGGRIPLRLDLKLERGALRVLEEYPESGAAAPGDPSVARAVDGELERLAAFLGAKSIERG